MYVVQKGLLITDGPFSGTGFSEEMRNVLFRLVQTGKFEFYWFSLQHTGFPVPILDSQFSDLPHKGAQIEMLGHRPSQRELFGAEHFPKHWATLSPDFVLFMGDPKNIRPYVLGNMGDDPTPKGSLKQRLGFPLYMYVTLDGLPIHPSWLLALSQVNLLIAMTEWAQLEYSKVGLSPAFIWHGINWHLWKTNEDEKRAIKKKYHIPEDYVIFINWDVPQHRKRTDALLRAWKMAKPETKKMKLILYSDWRMDMTNLGWNIDDLIRQYDIPRETIISPLQLQKSPKYWACPEKPEQLLEIAKLGDVYPSTTSGEGFGKCGLEAMSLGIVPIITDYSACSEVHQKGSILIPITGTFRMDDGRRGVEAGLVDEKKFAEAIEDMYYNTQKRKELSDEAILWSREFDYDTKIVPQWINLLESINPDELMMKELLKL